jgi:hypothetical protein
MHSGLLENVIIESICPDYHNHTDGAYQKEKAQYLKSELKYFATSPN